MKTIEERALDYANEIGIDSNTDYFDYCQQDYIAGATEQKLIDDAELHKYRKERQHPLGWCQFTIDEAIDFVRKGFKSTIAENPDYDAEGLVLKTTDGLMTRRGERIIFKIKTCDFKKYKAKYGTDAPVEQPQNPNYKG